MKGLSKKRILIIAILSLLFYLLGDGGDDLPETWLHKIYAGVAYFFLLLGLSLLWDILFKKLLKKEEARAKASHESGRLLGESKSELKRMNAINICFESSIT